MNNRYQRRKYRPSLASHRSKRTVPWQVYLLAVMVLMGVIYFRLLR